MKIASTREREWLAGALAVFAALLVSWTALDCGFVTLDDPLYLNNVGARGGLTPGGVTFAFTTVSTLYWHPLAWLSHELDFSAFGLNPAGHHLTSVLLHCSCVAVLFVILIRLGTSRLGAAGGALLWALSPLRVESYVWVAERKDVLAALFYLLAISFYVSKESQHKVIRWLTWNVCGVLALMAKPSAVSLPFVLLLVDITRVRSQPLRRVLIEKAPLLVASGLVMAVTYWGQSVSGSLSHLAGVPLPIRLENAVIAYFRYSAKILWPMSLSCFYPYDRNPSSSVALICLIGILALTGFAIRQRTRRPWILMGWLWFVIALAPNIGIVQAGRQSIADRFTELAAIGTTVMVVFAGEELWTRVPKLRSALTFAVVLAIGTLALASVRQIGYWRDSITLFQHAASIEDGEFVRGNLGVLYLEERRYGEAEVEFRRAIALGAERFEHHNNLANVLLRTGRNEEALAEGNRAVELAPADASVTQTMAILMVRAGNEGSALRYLDQAIRSGADPGRSAVLLNDAGVSFASRGNLEGAERLIRRAVELDPTLVQARRNLILVLGDQGRRAEAQAALALAVKETGRRLEYADLGSSAPGGVQ